MCKIKISVETMSRIVEVAAPLITEEAYVSLDFGTGQTNGEQPYMISKFSITNGTEQAEMAIATLIPEEIKRPLTECSVVNPLEKVVVKAKEFVEVAKTLLLYESEFGLEITNDKMILRISDKVEFPVYRCEVEKMKALVPHRQNCSQPELYDKDIMSIRMIGKELLEASKYVSAISRKTDRPTLDKVQFLVEDIGLVTQNIEVNGETREVPKYNAKVKLIGTDSIAMSVGTMRAYTMKGSARDLLARVPQEILQGITNPVISFKKESDRVVPIAQAYLDVKKGIEDGRNCSYSEDKLTFAIAKIQYDRIVKYASVMPDSYIDITVGEKYVTITLNGLQAIYVTGLAPLAAGNDFVALYEKVVGSAFVEGLETQINVDAVEMGRAAKLTQLYAKDDRISHYPVEIELEDGQLVVRYGESECRVTVLNKDEIKIDNLSFGISQNYLLSTLSCFSTGSFTTHVTFSGDKAYLAFTKGGSNPKEDEAVTFGGFANVEEAKARVDETLEAREAEKKKKEKKEKK